MNIDSADNRESWKVSYLGSKLAEAAYAKGQHHTDRLAWWQKTYDNVQKDIKEKGVTVVESQASSYSNAGMNPQVMVDVTLAAKLKEADAKIKEHANRVRQYNGWEQMMSANANKEFELTINDWLYFFGK